MPTPDQKEALEDALSGTLSRTIEFLKFAETKNAALLTFASAWSLALVNLLISSRFTQEGPRTAVAVCLLLFAVAALVALYSFLPRLRLSSFHSGSKQQSSLIYFGDIARFDADSYGSSFSTRYASDPEQVISDNYLNDLAVQVAANSSITNRKYNLFYVGATLVIFAVLGLVGTAAWMTYFNLWTK
ncbi:Pycsar system effector family protein [Bradyrhizobium sp. SZCCHNS2015]|uniref:Pycsar system effector family protein n=1 Tax=Bradyrhizobium sp. SZCCHNS2015 TaxID=3057305 RepID=UPI0028E5E56E|nr:Pycsar system effector family protein [Bradyrhizobium sp. SZCCHNS2015]